MEGAGDFRRGQDHWCVYTDCGAGYKGRKRWADYLGVGAVFPTSSKADAVEVEHATLRDICVAVQIPVVAIGGISAENVSQLAGTGIDGIAVISAIFAQDFPKLAAEELKKKVEAIQ